MYSAGLFYSGYKMLDIEKLMKRKLKRRIGGSYERNILATSLINWQMFCFSHCFPIAYSCGYCHNYHIYALYDW